jgi:hypothetical protein
MELGLMEDRRAVEGVVAVVGEMMPGEVLLSGLFGRWQRDRPQAILLSMISSVHVGLHISLGVGRLPTVETRNWRDGGTAVRWERR